MKIYTCVVIASWGLQQVLRNATGLSNTSERVVDPSALTFVAVDNYLGLVARFTALRRGES